MLKFASRSFKNRVTRRKPLVQSGGATFLEHYADRHIYIHEYYSNTGITVYGGPVPPKRPCFRMFIEDEADGRKSAELNDINPDNGCFLDDLTNSRDLVHVAVRFAIKRHNVILFLLSDNSTITCPEKVSLSNLSLVTTGFTWYQSCIPGLLPQHN